MANDRNDALRDYVEVNVRIDKFWAKHPTGRIDTEVIMIQDTQPKEVLVKALIYRDENDTQPAATGHAHEIHGSSYINKTSYIENCETSAVGRALAILGFEIKKSVASREEVANAQHQQRQQSAPKPTQNGTQSATKPNDEQTPQNEPKEPSDAQIKLLNALLIKSGYTKDDAERVFKTLSEMLGYEVHRMADINRNDVGPLADKLAKHTKGA